MTSRANEEAYVWIWLPGETSPVVAGRMEYNELGNIVFNYGRSYLERAKSIPPSIPIYEPELPLQPGLMSPVEGCKMPGCLRDASPDAWGRRVILNRQFGKAGAHSDTAELTEVTYLLESGADRIGALDFQRSPTEYIPRSSARGSIVELMASAERVEKGIPLTPELDMALFHGSSIGGARPKALLEDENVKYIVKFSSSTDLYSVIKAEFLAMRLAQLVGIDVAPVSYVKVAGRDVLLIERFDRRKTPRGWERKAMVSAMTLQGLGEMLGRYASYEALAEIIRHRFSEPEKTLKELFSRLVFNILCGNTDDHARNHSAFWDGKTLSLTPAYDVCPQGRSGGEPSQAMFVIGNDRSSRIQTCLRAAHLFLLDGAEARQIVDTQIEGIHMHWENVCEEAELSLVERQFFWKRQFLNPYAFEQA